MSDAGDTLPFETCLTQIVKELSADAVRRFGDGRTMALHSHLAGLADDIAKVRCFPLSADDRPGFFILGRD